MAVEAIFLPILVLGVTLAGGFLPIKLPKSVSLLMFGALVVSAIGVLLPEAFESVGWFLVFPLVTGILIDRYIAPCRHDQLHPTQPSTWWLAGLTIFVLLFHSILDGHLLAEFQFGVVGLSILYHKFLDGLSVDIISYDMPKIGRYLVIAMIVAATPLGFWFLPAGVVSPVIDGLLLSFVSGIYLASVWSLYTGGQHHLHH
ncbi:MAG: hypothetical protein AAB499_02465 [Patescibacteria group bacterium]